MATQTKLDPNFIWKGLLDCDRETLAIFIALFEDSKGLSLLSDRISDFKEKGQKKYSKLLSKEATQVLDTSTKDHFSKRLEKTAHKIKESNLSDEALKTALWEHLLNALDLDSATSMFPRDIKRHCDDIAHKMIKSAVSQKTRKSESAIQRYNPFNKKHTHINFEDAADYLISNITKEAINQDSKIKTNIKKEISTLDYKISKQAGASHLTESAINKTLITGGSLLGLMGGVQAAGFGAYIMAAQASAIIPLVGGKTLVSLLFVVTNPLFVITAITFTGLKSKGVLEKSIKQSFGIIISTLLLMRGMIKLEGLLETESFLSQYNNNLAVLNHSNVLNTPHNYDAKTTSPVLTEIKTPNITADDQNLLLSKIEVKTNKEGAILKIYPSSIINLENTSLAGLTFADFIYDIASINPHVIEATNFARKVNVSDAFEFSIFSESLKGLSEASLRGHHANLMGYTAERVVASQLIKDGHIVEIPESATQPGYDLLVDGHEFQVKCIQPENFSILEKHFEKYPDTPVIANEEVFNVIAEKVPEWSDLVFYVSGYTHENASGLLTQSIEAGQALDDYEILSSIAVVSAVRNTISLKKGEQSFQSATFNIALDSLTKGSMAITGGVAGTGIGMILFGPAGAYILGGISTVFGATQGKVLINWIDKALDPERENLLKAHSNNLLKTCNIELTKKIKLIDEKIAIFSDDGISSYVKARLEWEKLYFQVTINRHETLINNKSFNGIKKISKALKLASESTVHPYCLQDSYKKIANTLNQKIDRIGKTNRVMKKVFNKIKNSRAPQGDIK
jgi:hypothetical protein